VKAPVAVVGSVNLSRPRNLNGILGQIECGCYIAPALLCITARVSHPPLIQPLVPRGVAYWRPDDTDDSSQGQDCGARILGMYPSTRGSTAKTRFAHLYIALSCEQCQHTGIYTSKVEHAEVGSKGRKLTPMETAPVDHGICVGQRIRVVFRVLTIGRHELISPSAGRMCYGIRGHFIHSSFQSFIPRGKELSPSCTTPRLGRHFLQELLEMLLFG
jgi:hypothetical protein